MAAHLGSLVLMSTDRPRLIARSLSPTPVADCHPHRHLALSERSAERCLPPEVTFGSDESGDVQAQGAAAVAPTDTPPAMQTAQVVSA
jgi:hypothetical protein